MPKVRVIRRPVSLSLESATPATEAATEPATEATVDEKPHVDGFDDARVVPDATTEEGMLQIAWPRTSTATVSPAQRLAVMKRTRKEACRPVRNKG